MPTQTATETVDAAQSQSTPSLSVPSNEAPQPSSPDVNAGGEDIDSKPSDMLPEPNNKLSDELTEEQEFRVTFYADEDEKIFDGVYHNEDHLLKEYWKVLKEILETPCENRNQAYQSQCIAL